MRELPWAETSDAHLVDQMESRKEERMAEKRVEM